MIKKERQLIHTEAEQEDLFDEITSMRRSAFRLADKYSSNKKRTDDSKRNIIITSAILYLLGSLIRRVAISDKESYSEKVKQAVADSDKVLDRLVSTEVYEAYRKKMASNCKKVKWNAINDTRTCDFCQDLDGKVFEENSVPEGHPSCRCWVDEVDYLQD
jgi:SPP1 gp7 family putative phage head morphogenesis protein